MSIPTPPPPPSSATSTNTTTDQSPVFSTATARDIFLWRRKKASVSILAVATATWFLLEIYDYNFLTVASYLTMFMVVSMFIWGNLLRLAGKQPPPASLDDRDVEFISEKAALETAYVVKAAIEEALRWMLRVGAESDWFVFGGTVCALWVISQVAGCFHLLTLLYIGLVMAFTVPAVYVKNEDKIKRSWENVKVHARRLYERVDDKFLSKIKQKVCGVGHKGEEVVERNREEVGKKTKEDQYEKKVE